MRKKSAAATAGWNEKTDCDERKTKQLTFWLTANGNHPPPS